MTIGWYRLRRSGEPFHGTIPMDAEVLDGPPTVEHSAPPAPPAKSANKSVWVDYAVQCGWAPEDAERKTKDELVAELGQQDVDAGEGSGTVGPEVAGVELGTDLAQGGLIEPGGFIVGEQGPELLERHEDEA